MGKVETKLHGHAGHLKTRVDVGSMLTEEHYAIEREKIFRRAWLPLCHTTDVPERGSYVVQEVPTFNLSLLVMRGHDDKVRVFHNACRHRGNKLVREGAGTKRNLSCNFHGWVFSPEGELKLITDEHQFEAVDKSELGLIEVTSQVWETFVFINLDESPRETLEEWLGEGFYKQYDNGYFERHEHTATYVATIDCNWHLCVNSFTEGYHTLYLHKNTARDYQGGKINPQRHRPHMELMKRHHRYSAPGNPDHQVLPMEGLAIKYGRKLLPAFDFDFSTLPQGVNPSRYEHWGFDVVEFFPNFVLLTGNNQRAELTFWPVDAGRTMIVARNFAYKTKNLGERLSRDYFRSRGRDVVREDLNTLEAQQQVLKSGVLPFVLLSRQEMALQHHFAVTQDMLDQS
jgi:phenylpropionate dioxygenase-like ring-hydroxylating dioxygenase large terminal subunit